ncbi:MAG: hypothetical protein WCK95_12595 [Alphaproteobacteria bacterium]|jgi:hypothetical protein
MAAFPIAARTLRTLGLIALPTLALLPWFLFFDERARNWGLTSNIVIQAVTTITPELRASEFGNRLLALSSTFLLALIAVPVGFVALASVWRSTAKPAFPIPGLGRRPVVLLCWLLWFMVMAIGLSEGVEQVVRLFGDDFNARTVARDHAELLRLVKVQYYVSAIAASFAGSALAAAATCIVFEAEDPATTNLPALEKRANLVLYATAAVLVAGVLTAEAWSSWPNPLVRGFDDSSIERIAAAELKNEKPLPGEADAAFTARVKELKENKAAEMKANAKAFKDVKTGFLAVQGVCYVIGLAFTYLPAALAIYTARSRPQVTLTQAPTSFEQLVRILVLLSPLLVGPISKLIEVLSKLGG